MEARLFPVGLRVVAGLSEKPTCGYTFWRKGGEDGFARISCGRWMPMRGGALSAKGLAFDGLQLPLQGLPAFLRSGMFHVDDRA